MELIKTNNINKDFLDLITSLDNDLNQRYGIQPSDYDKHNQIESIETVLIGYVNNIAVACGCFKSLDNETIEMKRIYVTQDARGKGFSFLLLKQLESCPLYTSPSPRERTRSRMPTSAWKKKIEWHF